MRIVLSSVLVCFIASFGLTFLVRRYALNHSVMDIPNDRSSHAVPTPRGGGLAFSIVITGASLVGFCLGLISKNVLLGVVLPAVIIAIVGFVDDHQGLSSKARIVVHFFSVSTGIYFLGGLPPLPLFGVEVNLGFLGDVIAVIGTVWLLNLYNFMDGIDGIAGVEGVTVSVVMGTLWLLVGNQISDVFMYFVIASSVLGFLMWNFPPAKIFMGDVGSAFLGILIGLLIIETGTKAQEFLWVGLIMLGVFIVDSTVTLLVRLMRGEKVYQAHRSHAYQHAARRYGHRPVTLAVLVINLLWLAPISAFVAFGWVDGVIGILVAYLPLVLIAIRFRAGQLEE